MDVAVVAREVAAAAAALASLAERLDGAGSKGVVVPDRASADAALSLLAEVEVLRRRAEYVATLTAGAYAAWSLSDWIAGEFSGGSPSAAQVRRIAGEVAGCSAKEMTLATGVPESVAHERLVLAAAFVAEPARTVTLREAMCAGAVGVDRAHRLFEATAEIPAVEADALAARVLSPCRGGGALSPQKFSRRLSYHLARCVPVRERRAAELERRGMWADYTEVGTGHIGLDGSAEDVVAAHRRVDGVARLLRAAGDERTLAQLRSDIALRLLCEGILPEGGITYPDGTLRPMAPAKVTVSVSLATLVGASDEPGLVEGVGWLPASLVTDLAHRAGSTWRRLVTDPTTGAAVELSSKAYAAPPRLRGFIEARDVACRGPGCTVPACRCDLDHGIDYPAGPTNSVNLSAKHRPCHNRKTRGLWLARHNEDGSITWTTRSGRTYISYPWAYGAPDGELPDAAPTGHDDKPGQAPRPGKAPHPDVHADATYSGQGIRTGWGADGVSTLPAAEDCSAADEVRRHVDAWRRATITTFSWASLVHEPDPYLRDDFNDGGLRLRTHPRGKTLKATRLDGWASTTDPGPPPF